MSVSAIYHAKLLVREVLASAGLTDEPTRVHQLDYAGGSGELTATTTPTATDVWSAERTLVAGADSIDLVALTEVILGSTVTKSFAAKRIVAFGIAAHPDNSSQIQWPGGGSSYRLFGLTILGDTGGYIAEPGSHVVKYCKSNLPLCTSSPAVRTIACESADSDAKYEIVLVAGV